MSDTTIQLYFSLIIREINKQQYVVVRHIKSENIQITDNFKKLENNIVESINKKKTISNTLIFYYNIYLQL